MLPLRRITVAAVHRVTPRLARVTFTGDDLAAFVLDAPDRQVKLYFPRPGRPLALPPADLDFSAWYAAYTAQDDRPWMRSYTIRAHDPATRTVDVDFVLHDHAGPATRWAMAARPGDTIAMFGPSDDYARPIPIVDSVRAADWFLLAGDETALPAIGTLLEALPDGTPAVAYVEIRDAAEEQPLPAGEIHWIHRGARPHGEPLVETVTKADLPSGTPFVWLGGEAGTVRTLRRHLTGDRGVTKRQIDFTGNWRRALTQDDLPTAADVADAGELVAHAQELTFDRAYASHTAPWVIDGPQPAVVALEAAGLVGGAVLDPGCGTAEHAIFLTRRGYAVTALDASPVAVAQARANAIRHGVPELTIEVGDARHLTGAYDTVVDSALFHVFDDADRAAYVGSLARVCRSGALVHVLALSDEGPGFGPQIGRAVITDAFAGGAWQVEEVARSRYRGVVGAGGEHGDLPAWLARIRRR